MSPLAPTGSELPHGDFLLELSGTSGNFRKFLGSFRKFPLEISTKSGNFQTLPTGYHKLRGLYFFRRPSLFIIYFDWLQTPIFFKSLRSHGALSKFPHPPCGDILAISQLPLHPQRLDRSGSGAKRHVRCPAPKDRCDMHIGTRGVPSSPECILGGKWEEWLRKQRHGEG